MNDRYKLLEDALLKEADLLIEKAKSQGEKALYNLFKSAILKKYKDLFDKELSEGTVHKETINDAVEFCYTDICVSIRQIPKMNETEKEHMIQLGKQAKETVKPIIEKQLIKEGINSWWNTGGLKRLQSKLYIPVNQLVSFLNQLVL